MKYILSILLIISACYAQAQYNPTLFNNQNTAMGFAQASPSDARSMLYDQTASPKVFRDFQNKTEVINYLTLTKNRFGGAPIFIHNGGSLVNGIWIGGTRDIYIFKDSTDINSLVYWNTVQSVNGQTGAVVTKNADSLKGFPVDTSLRRQGYALVWDSLNRKIILAPNGSGALTAGTGIDITGGVITALNNSPLWNANQFRSRSISTATPNVGNVYKWNGVSWVPSPDLSALDTAYFSNDTLYLVGNSDTSIVVLNDFNVLNDHFNVEADSLGTMHFEVENTGNPSPKTGIDLNLDSISIHADNIHYTQIVNKADSLKLIYANNAAVKKYIKLDTTAITIVDNINSFGQKYGADYSVNGKANPRWLPDIAAVRNTIHDSSGNYIRNDTTIVQNGGFKLGAGSRSWLDTARATTLYLGNYSNFNNTLVRASNIFSVNDTLNPVNSKRGVTTQCRTGFTSAPPSVYFSYGGAFEAIIKAENNQNWNAQIHPVIAGVSSQVYGLSGATGILPKAATYYGTCAINTGLTVDEYNLIDLTYQHSGTLNHSNGIRIADIDAGTNGIGIYNVLGDGNLCPNGQWFLYDSTGYNSHFAGAIETRGLDNYLTNIASSYTSRTKPDVNFVDSLARKIAHDSLFSFSASNGLTKIINDVQLGGALTTNTNIDLAGNTFSLLGNGGNEFLTVDDSTQIIGDEFGGSHGLGLYMDNRNALRTIQLGDIAGAGNSSLLTIEDITGKLNYSYSGNNKFTVTNTGFGIKTSTPAYTLDVAGGGRFTDTLRVNLTRPGTAATDSILVKGSDNSVKAVAPIILSSGTYTPTLTGVTNISSSTARQCQWSRVGNIVTVSGSLNVTTTAITIESDLGISLPISSDITASENIGGSAAITGGTASNGLGVYLSGDATNNRANIKFATTATITTTGDVSFTFTYLIQ